MARIKLMRTKWYPNPHATNHAWSYNLTGANVDTTIYPILMYDEGLGTPSARKTNPENSAFATSSYPNCFVDSRVDSVFCQLRMSMSSKCLDDNITAIRFAYMPIHIAFKESYDATDETTGFDIKSILELQHESTDRQGFPLYAVTKMITKWGTQSTLHANVPGLTSTQAIEGVAFVDSTYYSNLHYYTNAGKLKSVQSGLKWGTLTQDRPFVNIPIHIKSNVKALNPYAFFGVLIHVPIAESLHQIMTTADTTASTNYVYCDIATRFDEWNPDFDFKKV